LDVRDILVSKGFKAKAVFPNFEYKSYDAEKLHHPVKMNDQEKEACEFIKKAFTQDKQYNFNFFPSP